LFLPQLTFCLRAYLVTNRTQLNSYPPKPKSNVDLFTSYVYGDEGVTVTLVVKTCAMLRSGEIPNLHVELFMAPPMTM